MDNPVPETKEEPRCGDNACQAEIDEDDRNVGRESSVTMVAVSEDKNVVEFQSDEVTNIEGKERQAPPSEPIDDDCGVDSGVPVKVEPEDVVLSNPQSCEDPNIQNINLERDLKAEVTENVNVKIELAGDDLDTKMDVDTMLTVDPTESKVQPRESPRADLVSQSESGVGVVTHGTSHVSVSTGGEVTGVTLTDGTSLVGYSSSDSEGDSEESSSSSSTSSESESDDKTVKEERKDTKSKEEDPAFIPQPPKTKKELMLEDLPSVPYVDFRLGDSEEISLLGKVSSIIGQLVVVGSNKDTPALNEETVLFGQSRHPIGVVFEIFGPVSNPFYTVRFNSTKDISDLELKLNDDIYFAPKQEEITKYVFVRELRAMKGSDASWANDEEPPAECLDYSDDEDERNAKKKRALGDGKRKDARRSDGNSLPRSQDQRGYSKGSSGHVGNVSNYEKLRSHHQQFRGPNSQHPQQQSYHQRRPHPQWHPPWYPPFQGSQTNPSPWQHGGQRQQPSNFEQGGNWQADYLGQPVNSYSNHSYHGGHMYTAPPPPVYPYSTPPPSFAPPPFPPFAQNVPPPVPPGMPPVQQGFQEAPS